MFYLQFSFGALWECCFFFGFPSSLRVRSNLFISKTVAVGVKYESSITSAGFKDGN